MRGIAGNRKSVPEPKLSAIPHLRRNRELTTGPGYGSCSDSLFSNAFETYGWVFFQLSWYQNEQGHHFSHHSGYELSW